ncbi:MAG: DUF4350 domain-containing protein [Acidobacteriota bacterium]
MKRIVLIALAVGALVAGGYLVREQFFEKTTVTLERGYQGEAAYNPYFALRELYTGLGAPAETTSGVQRLPPNNHALILAMDDRALVDKEVRSLMDWVRGGGHLVVPASHFVVAAPFLDIVETALFDEDEDDGDDARSESVFRTQRTTWPKLVAGDRPVIRSDGEDDAAWVLSYAVGDGQITVPVALAVLRNLQIGDEDHAELAWWLVQDRDGGAPAGVWIAYRQAPVSVWSLLIQRGRPVVLALVLLTVAGLALYARPFGPKHEARPRDRRHLAEHVRATGRYLWDRDVEHTLLRAVQGGVERRLARGGQPNPRQLVELVKQECARSGADPERLHAALTLPSTRDPNQFTDAIVTLEALRRKPS